MVSKLVKRFIVSVFVLLTMSSLEIFSMEPPISVRNVWNDDEEVLLNNVFKLQDVYKDCDGFTQWKTDADYLMSFDFLENLFSEIGIEDISECKYRSLLSCWTSISLYSDGFGGGCWQEAIRDSAIIVINNMIDIYQAKVFNLPKCDFKETMLLFIDDMILIKGYFGKIIDYSGNKPIISEK